MKSTDALWLYGSVARGTHGPTSDLDILWVTDNRSAQTSKVTEHLADLPQLDFLAVRKYSWREVIVMAGYGSLFLHHIALEGQPLMPGEGKARLEMILGDLPAYTKAAHDVRGFRIAVTDVRNSLLDGGDPAFELSTVATIIRHASILACFLLGNLVFDRRASITYAFGAAGMEELIDDALALYEHRLLQARGIPPTTPASAELAWPWLAATDVFIDRLEAIS